MIITAIASEPAKRKEKVIELYEAWNKPEKAEEWRAKLPQTEAIKE